MTNGRGEWDGSVVPEKPPNKAEGPAAEAAEGRGLAKGPARAKRVPRGCTCRRIRLLKLLDVCRWVLSFLRNGPSKDVAQR
jgi:hypothetical protein